jgi:mRNA-degrading endonuclease RelE of RelBE toxin-antitoxin system
MHLFSDVLISLVKLQNLRIENVKMSKKKHDVSVGIVMKIQPYALGRSYKANLRINLSYFYRIHSINYARIIFSANLSIRTLILSIVLYC